MPYHGYLLLLEISLREVRAHIMVSLANSIDAVDWYPVSLIGVDHLLEINNALVPFMTGYSLLPRGHRGLERTKISLSVLKPPREMLAKLDSNNWQEIVFPDEMQVLKAKHSDASALNVKSSPFALVNPAIFVNYLSSGNISYIATGEEASAIDFILSDLRYLEGMEGGVAFISKPTEATQCIGLVGGCLKKKSGEGDLTVIVPWRIISTILSTRVKSIPPQTLAKNPINLVYPWLAFNGVVMIEVNYSNVRRGWGSGILLDDKTIVSNMHLLGSDYQRATAWISETEYVALEVLGNPLKGLDMVFFGLTKPIPAKLAQPVTLYDGPYEVGQAVRSLGYGLIYPHRTGDLPFQPLVSNGLISRVVSMDLFRQIDLKSGSVDVDNQNTSNDVPALLVASAGCWNGSSGGALFDAATGHVVSMMTSNGRVNETGDVIPEMAFSLPSNVLRFAWGLLKKKQTQAVSQRLTSLWQLEETHVNAMVETSLPSKL